MATVPIEQDRNFVGDVRMKASQLLELAEELNDLQARWNVQFGGASRLGAESFDNTTSNEGLVKADISAALGILNNLVSWLDEAGQNRRGYLEKIRP